MRWYMRWIINILTVISAPIRWWDDRRRSQGAASATTRTGDPRQITRREHSAMKDGGDRADSRHRPSLVPR